jgi:hypothetical protein
MTGVRAAATLALLALASGCGDDGRSVDTQSADIIGGSIAYGYPEAVIVNPVRQGGQSSSCSGVLLAPRVVLTAGHCVDGFVAWGVYAAMAEEQGTLVYEAEVYDWDSGLVLSFATHDIGLVYLDEDFLIDRYPTIASERLDSGDQVVAVGRVIQGTPSLDWLFASEPFPVFNASPFGNGRDHPHHYFSEPIIEKGDSGGPVFAHDEDGGGPRTIVAVNSSFQYLARVDELRDWILERIAAHP